MARKGLAAIAVSAALVGVGVLAIRARDLIADRFHRRGTMWLPVIGAGAITLVGLVLTMRALAQF